jgi:hypothetical protein
MRAPPPVEFPSALGRVWRGALSVLVAVAVAVPLAWGLPYLAVHWGSPSPDALVGWLAQAPAQVAIACGGGLVAFAAAWLTQRGGGARERTLRWDGQDWVLAGDAGRAEERGDVALMLDLGSWMLVRFLPCAGAVGGAGTTWLPLTLGGDLARWAALRGALWNWRGARRPGAGRP